MHVYLCVWGGRGGGRREQVGGVRRQYVRMRACTCVGGGGRQLDSEMCTQGGDASIVKQRV